MLRLAEKAMIKLQNTSVSILLFPNLFCKNLQICQACLETPSLTLDTRHFFFALNEKEWRHEQFYFYSFRGHYTFIRFRVLNPKDNYFFA